MNPAARLAGGSGIVNTLSRIIAGRKRLFVGTLAGIAVACLLPHAVGPVTRSVVSWDVGVATFLVLSAWLFGAERSSRMAEDAARQQEGEWTIFALTIGATIISFVAIFGEFAMSDARKDVKTLRVALVALTLFVSWLMTHTTFAFRYAHEYYSHDLGLKEIDRGLDFPGEKHPDYLDFMYFSLVLGMTFQVSDVQITSRKMRRLATVHGLLSFLYNTIIVALTVNIAAGML
jgi:uncharacterized membrane protein